MQAIASKDRKFKDLDHMKRLLEDKHVFRLGGKQRHSVYAAIHRAKVKRAMFTEQEIRSRGEEGIQFGTLELKLDTTLQGMHDVRIGVLDVRREPNGHDASILADGSPWTGSGSSFAILEAMVVDSREILCTLWQPSHKP